MSVSSASYVPKVTPLVTQATLNFSDFILQSNSWP